MTKKNNEEVHFINVFTAFKNSVGRLWDT